MEDSQNPHETDQDYNNDNFDSNLVGVTIHNLSQGITILEKSDYSDENDRQHGTGVTEPINTATSCLSLYDRYWPREDEYTDVDDDII